MPAYAAAHVVGVRTPDGRETEGWFVAAPLLPQQMLEFPRERVYERILKAIEIGVELGAEVAGLGAFTGVVGDGGVTIAERSPIPVTTGNSLTIAAGVRSLFRAANEMSIDAAGTTAVVVGATGSIGAACVELIGATRRARDPWSHATKPGCENSRTHPRRAAVHVVGDHRHRRGRAAQRSGLDATTSTSEVIEPEDLRTGAVVCELSLPHDVSRRVAAERPDVLVVEGGNMRAPGDMHWWRVREPGHAVRHGPCPQVPRWRACRRRWCWRSRTAASRIRWARGIELAKVPRNRRAGGA